MNDIINPLTFYKQFQHKMQRLAFALQFSEKGNLDKEKLEETFDENNTILAKTNINIFKFDVRCSEDYKFYIRECCVRDAIEYAVHNIHFMCILIDWNGDEVSEEELIEKQKTTLVDTKLKLTNALTTIEKFCNTDVPKNWEGIKESLLTLYNVRNNFTHHMSRALREGHEINFMILKPVVIDKNGNIGKIKRGQTIGDSNSGLEADEDGNMTSGLKKETFEFQVGKEEKIILSYSDTFHILQHIDSCMREITKMLKNIDRTTFKVKRINR